jgi:TetR/AcrR family transcriptional repressor of lmrAB and yxaGH operons
MTADVSARARLVASAVSLFQAKGYAGVGVAEILAAAKAPKGCLYHHFPTGKEGLAVAAAEWIAEDVDAELARLFGKGLSPAAALSVIADATAEWLTRTQCAQGALIALLASAAGDEAPALRTAVARAYGRWQARIAATLGGPDADAQAALAIASLEGAIVMARAARDPDLVRRAMAQAGLVLAKTD